MYDTLHSLSILQNHFHVQFIHKMSYHQAESRYPGNNIKIGTSSLDLKQAIHRWKYFSPDSFIVTIYMAVFSGLQL